MKAIISAKSADDRDLSEEVGESYKLFGSILLSQGQMEKALKYFKKVRRTAKRKESVKIQTYFLRRATLPSTPVDFIR